MNNTEIVGELDDILRLKRQSFHSSLLQLPSAFAAGLSLLKGLFINAGIAIIIWVIVFLVAEVFRKKSVQKADRMVKDGILRKIGPTNYNLTQRGENIYDDHLRRNQA